MRARDLVDQLRGIPDHVNVTVRLDLSTDDESTEEHRAEGSDLVEVMKIRTYPKGPVEHACIFVANCKEWGRPSAQQATALPDEPQPGADAPGESNE